ncbi:hypothetical protein KBC03_08375 [Patescibacteria group bacterium]|nr:hypothetical protein [Patescibacteria group bacterium]
MRKLTLLIIICVLINGFATAQMARKAMNQNPKELKQYNTLQKILLIMESSEKAAKVTESEEDEEEETPKVAPKTKNVYLEVLKFMRGIQQANNPYLENTYFTKFTLHLPQAAAYSELQNTLSVVSDTVLQMLKDSVIVRGKAYQFATPAGVAKIAVDSIDSIGYLYGKIGVLCWTYSTLPIGQDYDKELLKKAGTATAINVSEIILADNIPATKVNNLIAYIKQSSQDATQIAKTIGRKPKPVVKQTATKTKAKK